MSWRVVFERPSGTFVVKIPVGAGVAPGAQRIAVGDALARFRTMVRETMAGKTCGSFVVGVHQDGPDCDHEP